MKTPLAVYLCYANAKATIKHPYWTGRHHNTARHDSLDALRVAPGHPQRGDRQVYTLRLAPEPPAPAPNPLRLGGSLEEGEEEELLERGDCGEANGGCSWSIRRMLSSSDDEPRDDALVCDELSDGGDCGWVGTEDDGDEALLDTGLLPVELLLVRGLEFGLQIFMGYELL